MVARDQPGRVAVVKSLLKALPRGTAEIAFGLGTLGLCAYLFLLVAGRVLGDAAYAPLGALWILVFLLGPAFLYPVEQELSRAIASRKAKGDGERPVLLRGAVLTAGLVVALGLACAAFYPLLESRLFDGSNTLFFGLFASVVSYAIAYLARGLFAGRGELRCYGILIALEGVLRLLAGIVLAVMGVENAGAFGLAVGFGPLAAVLATIVIARTQPIADGSQAKWSELTASMGHLVAGALLSQVLVNSSALIVKALASPTQQAEAGAFAKAVVITRIPLFLFQAIQAISLPRLATAVTLRDKKAFDATYRILLVGVIGVGALGVVGALVLGDELLVLFGSDTGLGRIDITLLAAGNAAFLVAMAVAQGLIAIHRQGLTVWGWLAGVVVMIAVVFLPGDLLLRVELSLVMGAAVSALLMQLMLMRSVPKALASGEAETGVESTSVGGDTAF